MVDDNIIRSEKVKNLDHIMVLFKDGYNTQTYFKGSDIADYKVHVSGSIVRLSILTIHGYKNTFYNVAFNIVYNNQDKIVLDNTNATEFEYM